MTRVSGRRSRLAGVLFDVDGTLVDTTYLHTVCWWQALHQNGRDVPMARIHRGIGMGSDQLLARLLGEGHDPEVGRRISTAHADLYGVFRERLTPLPGARDLLQRCADQGLTVVLASSAKSDDLRVLRAALDADEFITAATSSMDADESKPAPGILQAALESSALKPADVVYVGDSVWDVEAAGRLGISCVGLECGGTGAAELTAAGAIAIYADPAELLAAIDDSPLGQNWPPAAGKH